MKVPEGWKRISLEELGTIQTGVAKNEGLTGNLVEVPYLRVANVQDGRLALADMKAISVPEDRLNRYRLQYGDVLLTEGGDFDKLGRGTVWRSEIDLCIHQNHVFVVRTHKELLPEFLSLLTGSSYGKAYFQSCSKQSTNLASINSTQLKAFPVILPPLPEQKAIAKTLSTWDTAIETMERLIATKESAFRHLRAEAIHQAAVMHKVLRTLSQAFQPLTRKNTTGETNVLTTSAQRGLVSQQTYFSKSVASENLEGYFLVERGDFAYNRSSSNGYPYGAIKRLDDSERGVLSTLNICMSLREPGHHNSDYFVHVFEAGYLNRGLTQICQEGARSHGLLNVSREDFFGLEIPIPDKATQDRIADKLNLVQSELTLLRKQLDLLNLQKRGLMQKLLTGTWRVPVPQETP